MGGDEKPAQTTQVSQIQLPAWVEQASQSNYNLAKQVADRPLVQYGGETVAGPNQMTTDAYAKLMQLVNGMSPITTIDPLDPQGILKATNPLFTQARDLFTRSTEMPDIQAWLNPYINEVEQRAIGNANTALDRRLLGVSDAARKSGAFGGSRAAIERGVTSAEGVRGIGDLSAELRSRGFDTATANALASQTGMRTAAQGILSTAAGVQGAQEGQQSALIRQQQQEMAKRQQEQDISMANIASLIGAGGKEESRTQAALDWAKQKFYEMRDYPIEQLNIRLAALGMSPYGRTETSTKTATGEDKGTDWASVALGAAKAAPAVLAMFSDRDDKTDIKKLGKDPDTGLDMYAYRYKGDPKSYPKVVGPMAQDIERRAPKSIKKIGGHRVVNLENLMEALR